MMFCGFRASRSIWLGSLTSVWVIEAGSGAVRCLFAQVELGEWVWCAWRQRLVAHLVRSGIGGRKLRVASIGETGGQPPQQLDLAIHLTQKQRPAVTGHSARREPGFNAARKMRCKILATLCKQRPLRFLGIHSSRQRSYATKTAAFCNFFFNPELLSASTVRNAG